MTALWVTAASPEATLSLEFFGPWQAPGDEDAVDDGLDRAELGVDLVEEPVLVHRQLEDADEFLVLARDHARDQDDEVGRDGELLAAGQDVA